MTYIAAFVKSLPRQKMLANSCGDCLTEMSSPELRSLDAVMGADEDVVICLQCLHVGCRR